MCPVADRRPAGAAFLRYGGNLNVTKLGDALGDVDNLLQCYREALEAIERLGSREGKGEQARLLLIECRKIARNALA
jgi:hypothetical protein